MPILDPSLQCSLFDFIRDTSHPNYGIILKYLKIASHNVNQSVSTLKAHCQFRDDFIKNIQQINQRFQLKIEVNETKIIRDYYSFFYKILLNQYKKIKKTKCRGSYVEFNQRPNLHYFRICGSTKHHCWYLTDCSLAILVCSFEWDNDICESDLEWFICLVNLEIDLMTAAGFTIASSFFISHKNPNIGKRILLDIIKTHPMAEIHFNLQFSKKKSKKEKYEGFFRVLHQILDGISGLFYLYRPFLSELENLTKILKNLRKKPFFTDIEVADDISKAFITLRSNTVRPFPYISNGFSSDIIRINLSNVALYDTEDETVDFTPSGFSDIGFGYIKTEDFLQFKKGRVKIYFKDNVIKYCAFDDIHTVNPELYVYDPFSLIEVDKETLDVVDTISCKSDELFSRSLDFKQQWFFPKVTLKAIQKILSYVLGGIRMITYRTKCIAFRNSQIFAVYQAVKLFLHDQFKVKIDGALTEIEHDKLGKKRLIFQLHSGEGKSLIALVIAMVLALTGKKVHIATSNIFFALRLYHDSYEIFTYFGVKAAVLLHKEEVPIYFEEQIPKTKGDDDEEYHSGDEDEKHFHFKKSRFPDVYFGPELFENSTEMNINVCGLGEKKHEAQIIYSTFINFEALYVRLMESQPNVINDLFESTFLLIDEADSFLIDELTNGTILSRPMKTNGKEILIYVYHCKMNNLPAQEALDNIKAKWPNYEDLTKRDIEAMFKEIDFVNSPECVNGSKYSIEKMIIDQTDAELNKQLFEEIDNIKETFEQTINLKMNAYSQSIDDEKTSNQTTITHFNHHQEPTVLPKEIHNDTPQEVNDSHLPFSERQKVEEMEKSITIKHIVPFDSDNEGILQPNKEFEGFIQQFIAIKEMFNNPKENQNMWIKDITLSYFHASHPIFINLYSGVCGFTNSIGGEYEQQIFESHYGFITKKIPGAKPNRRVDIPIVLCRSIAERNKRITDEVVQFNKRGNPVLVFFQNLNEIPMVYKMLQRHKIANINVFDGRNPTIQPNYLAGRRGAVSLGTNVCGRGSDIKKPEKPLHVIISYYTSNARVMQQAFGQTGRRGKRGSVHIICHRMQYLTPSRYMTSENIDQFLKDCELKNELQVKFINKFKTNHPWIFDPITSPQQFDSIEMEKLREARINVNRIVAYNFRLPLCLSVDTFLEIQIQKVFSLVNCPNCKFTWILFQRYIKEMIFVSWSLFVDHSERHFRDKSHTIEEKRNYMMKKTTELISKIISYLPNDILYHEIIEAFIYICMKVISRWKPRITKMYDKSSYIQKKRDIPEGFVAFHLGFRPFCLMDRSGARIINLDSERSKTFITDPELIYVVRAYNNNTIPVSITQAIDRVLDKICNLLSSLLGPFAGIKLFLRRTLFGCEFGFCLDFELHNTAKSLMKDNCLIDHDPLFVFAIDVKSLTPFLAGVLIFVLVFATSITSTISSFIAAFPSTIGLNETFQLPNNSIKGLLDQLLLLGLTDHIDRICQKISYFLSEQLQKQINSINFADSELATNLTAFLSAISPICKINDWDKMFNAISKFINKDMKTRISSALFQSFSAENGSAVHLFTISLLLILNIATFLFTIHYNRDSITHTNSKIKKYAAMLNKNPYEDEKIFNKLVRKTEKIALESILPQPKDNEAINEQIFLRIINLFAKDLGYQQKQFYKFNDVVEAGFIPKFIMYLLHIDSIEGVTDISRPSKEVQVQNAEACVRYLKQNNPTFAFLLFDFRTLSTVSYSVRSLIRNVMNLYFLKSTKEDMIERYNLLFGENITFEKEQFCFDREYLFKMAQFIVTGRTANNTKNIKDKSIFFKQNKLPLIIDFEDSNYDDYPDLADVVFYQMKLLFNCIDERKSRRLIEKINIAKNTFRHINLPKFSTLSSAIKAKLYCIEQKRLFDSQKHSQKSLLEEDTNAEPEPPTTYAERHKKAIGQIHPEEEEGKENSEKEQENELATPQEYWNPETMSHSYSCKNGILVNSFDRSDDNESNCNLSIEKWINTIHSARKAVKTRRTKSTTVANSIDSTSIPSLFTIPQSKWNEKLYRIFYFDQHINQWKFDANKFREFLKDKRIDVEGSNTPIISYLDSKESDLISMNGHFLSGKYPNFDEDPNENDENDEISQHSKKKREKKSQEEPNRDPKDIFVYALCDRSLSMLNYEVDFTDKNKASIKPIFLLLHIPEEKENLPNIQRILIQIYSFLSLISDIRVVVLDKMYYETQIKNMRIISNIVDSNLNKLLTKNEEEENELISYSSSQTDSESTSFSFSSSSDNDDNESNLHHPNIGTSSFLGTDGFNQIEWDAYHVNGKQMIYDDSKIIFLINDPSIHKDAENMDKCSNASEFFTNLQKPLKDKASLHFINIDDPLTYKAFLDKVNDICLSLKPHQSDTINNLECINDISHISTKYISLQNTESVDESAQHLRDCITERYESFKSVDKNADPLTLLSFIRKEIHTFSPKFDVNFQDSSEELISIFINEVINIDREKLKKELNQSATEKLEYLNYQLHRRFFWERQEIERIRRTHISFLEEEFFSIIQILAGKDLLYDENIDILNEQIERDKERLNEIFEPFFKKLKQKEIKTETKFEESRQHGTNYIMKETECVRELKVTLEMNDKMKTIIEQDF